MPTPERTVTAVIPTRNALSNDRADLLRSIDSLLCQDLPSDVRLQILIGDNASDDGSNRFIEQVAARHPDVITAVLRPENVGGIGNINDLLEQAETSDFVMIIADDDRNAASDRLALLIGALDMVPEASMATGTTVYQDGIDIVDRWCLADNPTRVMQLGSNDAADRVVAMMEVTDPINNADIFGLIRGSVVAEAGGLSSIRGSDCVFLGRLAALGPVVVVPDASFIREVGGLSTRPGQLTAEGWAAKATTAKEMVNDIAAALATEEIFSVLGERRAEVVAHLDGVLTASLVETAERLASGEANTAPTARFSESNRLDNPLGVKPLEPVVQAESRLHG